MFAMQLHIVTLRGENEVKCEKNISLPLDLLFHTNFFAAFAMLTDTVPHERHRQMNVSVPVRRHPVMSLLL